MLSGIGASFLFLYRFPVSGDAHSSLHICRSTRAYRCLRKSLSFGRRAHIVVLVIHPASVASMSSPVRGPYPTLTNSPASRPPGHSLQCNQVSVSSQRTANLAANVHTVAPGAAQLNDVNPFEVLFSIHLRAVR